MTEPTLGQSLEGDKILEKSASLLLGQMLFEFSRLDVALGLCVVWTDSGQRIESLTKLVSEYGFHKKLDFLSQYIERTLAAGSEKRAAYADWIAKAHSTRLLRNEWVHGRWGTDPRRQEVINVIGLPTSPEQYEKRYTLEDLSKVLYEVRQQQDRLRDLRNRWPL